MHSHPRQNTTFSGLSGVYNALFNVPYRFSFNGQERTDEITGTGNHNTALYWEYDTRLGRRWNVDPVPQISLSDYSVLTLNPACNYDPLGNTATRCEDEKLIRETEDKNWKVVTVLDEQMEDSKIWENIGDKTGTIDTKVYNDKLTQWIEAGYIKWERFTDSKVEVTAGAQGEFEFSCSGYNFEFTINAGSVSLFSNSSQYINGREVNSGLKWFGKNNGTEIKREFGCKFGGGVTFERTRTAHTTAGMGDDAAKSLTLTYGNYDNKMIERNNVYIHILFPRTSFSLLGGIGIKYKIGTGIVYPILRTSYGQS